MARPFAWDLSHRPVERQCDYCGAIVLKKRCSNYKKAFCSKEHMIASMKANAFRFNCPVCSKEVLTQPAQVKYRNRRTCSHKCNAVLIRKATLERRKTYTKHQLDRLARYSVEAKQWRKSVFERDNYTCQKCSVRGTYLEADHIKPFAYYPELRYEISNGRTLCRPCHNKTKVGSKKMRELFEQGLL